MNFTELKNLQLDLEQKIRELERSNMSLEEFAHAASHDLKEPVRKIYVFVDRLKSKIADRLTEEETQIFKRVETSAERMKALIDDLLDYSHVSYMPQQKDRVDLNKKLALVLEDLELPIHDTQASIDIGKLPIIRGYRRQLQQLFQNLISNAIKYSKPGVPPHIRVTAQVVTGVDVLENLPETDWNKPFQLIEVADNGIGFEPIHAEHIFKVFYRLHSKTDYSGTGVGLSIARKVVANHGGYIWAESIPGKGARFKVLLPASL